MHYLIKQLIPPIFHTLRWYSFKYGWKGNYKSYEDARQQCKGYEERYILSRIMTSTEKVKNGAAAYERDGILYDKVQVNPNLLNVLLFISARNNNELTLIDFGGALGTSYYQNLPYLSHLKKLNWCIIEQPDFVREGKKGFENQHIRFYHSIEECLKTHPVANLLLISSTLQYISKPYDFLKSAVSYRIPYLMLDLIGYNDKKADRITIQYVPPVYYGIEASYPCTFFNRTKIESQLALEYDKTCSFISEHQKYYLQLRPFQYEGSFWTLKS